jgi:hypothetical protein
MRIDRGFAVRPTFAVSRAPVFGVLAAFGARGFAGERFGFTGADAPCSAGGTAAGFLGPAGDFFTDFGAAGVARSGLEVFFGDMNLTGRLRSGGSRCCSAASGTGRNHQ